MVDFKIIDVNDFYNLNNEQQKKYVERIKKEIKKSDNEIIKKMDRIVKRNVKSFVSDFYIYDLYLIKKYQSPFIWMTRETGTDFIPLGSVDNVLMSWYNAIKHTNEHFYFCDGRRLKKVSFEKMEKIIDEYKKD